MAENRQRRCTAFVGAERLASGPLEDVARRVNTLVERDEHGPVLIFDDATGARVDVDFSGTVDDVLARLAGPPAAPDVGDGGTAARGPGRPRLGVVAREVTLLPRHWEWLGTQPGGASVALRKLVEEARRANADADRVRQAREAAYRFAVAVAGDLPGFEEATRALFAGDRGRFDALVGGWPPDVGDYARQLAAPAFEPS